MFLMFSLFFVFFYVLNVKAVNRKKETLCGWLFTAITFLLYDYSSINRKNIVIQDLGLIIILFRVNLCQDYQGV